MKMFRNLKYRRQRAKGILPACDCWDYKYTLVDNIRQGLTYLLEKGCTDWDSPYHAKQKRELEFVLDWAKAFPDWDCSVFAKDEETRKEFEKKFGDSFMIVTADEVKEWEKRTKKAFEYLAKNIHGLWD